MISKPSDDETPGDASPADSPTELDPIVAGEEDVSPILRSVEDLLTGAVKAGATEIHIEPEERGTFIRYRVEGILVEGPVWPLTIRRGCLTRLKIIAGMDLTERRLPQNSVMTVSIEGVPRTFMFSTLPVRGEERGFLKILPLDRPVPDLASLGLREEDRLRIHRTLETPLGLILGTGPGGAGKTTTLYAILAELRNPGRTVLTIESHTSHTLKGAGQVVTSPSMGFTDEAAFRAALRQGPDAILLGSIQSQAIAEEAVKAAASQTRILTTLHAPDAASALARLLDMGLDPFLITSTRLMIISQRLVRKLCPHCKCPVKHLAPEAAQLLATRAARDGFTVPASAVFHEAARCDQCRHTGHHGQTAIFEILEPSENLKRLLFQRARVEELRQAAIGEGMSTLLADGVQKAATGETSLAEVFRVCG